MSRVERGKLGCDAEEGFEEDIDVVVLIFICGVGFGC